MMILLLTALVALGSALDVEERPQYGVLFRPQRQKLLVDHSVFNLFISLERPSQICLDDIAQNMSTYFSTGDRERMMKEISAIQNIIDGINSLLKSPVDSSPSNNRSTRALFGFLGELSRGLFGTATVSDVNKLAGTINQVVAQVNKNSDTATNQLLLLHNVVNATSKRVNDLQKEIVLNHDEIIKLSSNIQGLRKSTQKLLIAQQDQQEKLADLYEFVQTNIVGALQHKLIIFETLQATKLSLSNFLSGLLRLNEGYLTPILLPPHEFKIAINKAQNKIRSTYPGYDLVHEDLEYLYTHHLASFSYTNNHLLVHIELPFSNSEPLYDLYKVESFAMPIHANDPKSLGYTEITDLPSFFAISPGRNTFSELSSDVLSTCWGSSVLSCNFDHTLLSRQAHTCASSLFFQEFDKFTSLCKTIIQVQLGVPNQIIPVSRNNYYITSSDPHYRLVCPDRTIKKSPACALCKIQVPCDCTLHIADKFITPSLSSCNESSTTMTNLQPINYPVLLHLDFDIPSLPSIPLSNETIEIAIPNITDYVNKFKDLDNSQKQSGLDLAKVSRAILKQEDSYHSSHLETGLLSYFSEPSYVDIYIVVSGFMIVGLLAFNCYLLFRFRRLTLLLCACTTMNIPLPSAKALVISKPTTEAPLVEQSSSLLNFEVSLPSALTFILIVLLLGQLATYLCKCFANRSFYRRLAGPQRTDFTIIQMQLWNATSSCILELAELPHLNNVLSPIRAPRAVSLSYQASTFNGSISIEWDGDLSFFIDGQIRKFTLPRQIPVPLLRQSDVARMIKNKRILPIESSLRLYTAGGTWQLLYHYGEISQVPSAPELSNRRETFKISNGNIF